MGKNEKLVSIVLPTFNGSRFLRKSIVSCLNQGYGNIELIIVNDGSTEDIDAIVEEFKDPRLHYIKLKKNRGLPAALNTGFSNASGEYLTWTSDDNEYYSTAIETMVSEMERKGVDFVFADYLASYFDGSYLTTRRLPDRPSLFEKNTVGACFLYSRKVMETIGDYDTNMFLVEDYDYWIRVSRNFSLLHIPKTLYLYREHVRSLKTSRSREILLAEALLRFKHRMTGLFETTVGLVRLLSQMRATEIRNAKRRIRNVSLALRIMVPFVGICYRLAVFVLGVKRRYQTLALLNRQKREFKEWKKEITENSIVEEGNDGRRRILFIVPSFSMGGAERLILDLVTHLDKGRYSLHVLSTHSKNDEWIDEFRKNSDSLTVLDFSTLHPDMVLEYLDFIVEQKRIDVIITTNTWVGYYYLKNRRNVKSMDILHSEENRPSNFEIKETLPYVDCRICISSRLKDHVIRNVVKAGLDKSNIKKVRRIYNGIELKRYPRKDRANGNTFNVGYVGRLSAEKDPYLFLEVASEFKGSTDIRFHVYGDGPLDEACKRLKKRMNLDNVIFHGYVEDIIGEYANIDVLLITSDWEGIPYTILEALASGCYVISTDVGAINEVITDETYGMLIKKDEKCLVNFKNAIESFISGDMNEKKDLSRFTVERMAEEYDKAITGVLEGSLP